MFPQPQQSVLGRIVFGAYLATWTLLMFSFVAPLGVLLMPLLGWPATLMVLAGFGSLLLAALPMTVLAACVVIFRVRHHYWYVGLS